MVSEPSWAPVDRVPTYQLVLSRIEEQLVSRSLRPGDKLPPERELATMLGASRPAVREALRVLQAQGILKSTVGTGADSGTVVMAAPSGALTHLLRVHLAVASFPLSDFVEARVMLERSSAISAVRSGAIDADELDRILTAMERPDIGQDEFNELDTRFHVAIAESGGNRLVADLTVAVRESSRSDIHAALTAGPDWAGIRATLQAEHRAIAAALTAGDGPGAADLLEAHIQGFFRYMQQVGVAAEAAGS